MRKSVSERVRGHVSYIHAHTYNSNHSQRHAHTTANVGIYTCTHIHWNVSTHTPHNPSITTPFIHTLKHPVHLLLFFSITGGLLVSCVEPGSTPAFPAAAPPLVPCAGDACASSPPGVVVLCMCMWGGGVWVCGDGGLMCV